MKKTLFLGIAFSLMSAGLSAQVNTDPVILNDQEAEDIDSLNYLTEVMNVHGGGLVNEEKIKKSWSRNKYARFSYSTSKMSPKDVDETFMSNGSLCLDGTNAGDDLYDMKNDYGFSISLGQSFYLHKKPISKMIKFALDYTYIDLNYNHYKGFYSKEEGEGMKYNPNKKFTVDGGEDEYKYKPWGMDINEINYGMAIGPSITIAPLGLLDNEWRNLHLQTYFHVGYSISFIMFNDKESMKERYNSSSYYNNNDSGVKADFGTGVTTTWGINLSWKNIAIGYEQRKSPISYKSLSTKDYSKLKNKFDFTDSRVYISFNY